MSINQLRGQISKQLNLQSIVPWLEMGAEMDFEKIRTEKYVTPFQDKKILYTCPHVPYLIQKLTMFIMY